MARTPSRDSVADDVQALQEGMRQRQAQRDTEDAVDRQQRLSPASDQQGYKKGGPVRKVLKTKTRGKR